MNKLSNSGNNSTISDGISNSNENNNSDKNNKNNGNDKNDGNDELSVDSYNVHFGENLRFYSSDDNDNNGNYFTEFDDFTEIDENCGEGEEGEEKSLDSHYSININKITVQPPVRSQWILVRKIKFESNYMNIFQTLFLKCRRLRTLLILEKRTVLCVSFSMSVLFFISCVCV